MEITEEGDSLLACLKPREAEIVRARFGCDGGGKALTYEEMETQMETQMEVYVGPLPHPLDISSDATVDLYVWTAYPVKMRKLSFLMDSTDDWAILDASDPDADGILLVAGDCGHNRILFTDGCDYWYGIRISRTRSHVNFVGYPRVKLHPMEIESFQNAIAGIFI